MYIHAYNTPYTFTFTYIYHSLVWYKTTAAGYPLKIELHSLTMI